MDGISCIQGGHHVAQKLMNTTLPFRELNVTVLPSSPLKEISEVSAGASTFATSSAVILPFSTVFSLFLSVFPQAASAMVVMMKIPERTAKFLNCIFILNDFYCCLTLHIIFVHRLVFIEQFLYQVNQLWRHIVGTTDLSPNDIVLFIY